MVGRQVKPIITIIPVNNNNTCNSNSIYNYDKNSRDDDDDDENDIVILIEWRYEGNDKEVNGNDIKNDTINFNDDKNVH